MNMEQLKKLNKLKIALFISMALLIIVSSVFVLSFVGVIAMNNETKRPNAKEISPDLIRVNLGTIKGDGQVTFQNVAKLKVTDKKNMIVKLVEYEKSIKGKVSFIITGDLGLVGENNNYRIIMPCLLEEGGCARILVIIPGWDEPMVISNDEYTVNLSVIWRFEGEGEATISFTLAIQLFDIKGEN